MFASLIMSGMLAYVVVNAILTYCIGVLCHIKNRHRKLMDGKCGAQRPCTRLLYNLLT